VRTLACSSIVVAGASTVWRHAACLSRELAMGMPGPIGFGDRVVRFERCGRLGRGGCAAIGCGRVDGWIEDYGKAAFARHVACGDDERLVPLADATCGGICQDDE